ncbi:MAG: VOC family protein [Candidatus Sericytochromatia bacterium]
MLGIDHISIDHIGIGAHDPVASARFLAEVLGIGPARPAGPDGDLLSLEISGSTSLIYAKSEVKEGMHIAFQVDSQRFEAILERLQTKNLAFGNRPDQPDNRQTHDHLGGQGRVYFLDPNGHLFEVCA